MKKKKQHVQTCMKPKLKSPQQSTSYVPSYHPNPSYHHPSEAERNITPCDALLQIREDRPQVSLFPHSLLLTHRQILLPFKYIQSSFPLTNSTTIIYPISVIVSQRNSCSSFLTNLSHTLMCPYTLFPHCNRNNCIKCKSVMSLLKILQWLSIFLYLNT